MRVKVLYFAWLRERIGVNEEEMTLPEGTDCPAQLITYLRGQNERYEAAFADISAIRVAVDQEMTDLDTRFSTPREIAFFPPVTGG